MNDILILFNPDYEDKVAEEHINILRDKRKVAFGKIKSEDKNLKLSPEQQDDLEQMYKNVDEQKYLQLFLTDYSHLYVAKVIKVTTENLIESDITPQYYKKYDVEQWYIIDDIREIVRNDFEKIRDIYLSKFTTPHYTKDGAPRHFALYDNNYIYPLIINTQDKKRYFDNLEDGEKYYLNIYKEEKFLNIKNNIINYSFGHKYLYDMHPDTIDNIILAEIEYQANYTDPDSNNSDVVLKYSRVFEHEMYAFVKDWISELSKYNKDILNIEYYEQQFLNSIIKGYKPSYKGYISLLKDQKIKDYTSEYLKYKVTYYIQKSLLDFIRSFQSTRNDAAHSIEEKISLEKTKEIREQILGIACESIIITILKTREKLKRHIKS